MPVEKLNSVTRNKSRTDRKQRSAPAKEAVSSETKAVRVVGIGASAGGLEALEQFFTHVSADSGMAFVVVQHLDPTHHSAMPEILSRVTKMAVQLATDGMKIAPDSVYLIPPDKNIWIENSVLYLQTMSEPRGVRLPVDFFLRSLAAEERSDAICIILSGTGADGSLGLRDIKAEGGTAFAQDPKSARYDGMPQSAISTGLVDFVLSPEQMGQKLSDFVKDSMLNEAGPEVRVTGTADSMQRIFATLRNRTGHDFSQYKQSTIHRRLQRRMIVHGIDDIAEYVILLRESPAEIKALLKDLLISVTRFFRDPQAFDVLEQNLKEQISGRSETNEIRVWVAGCATGEEAYSVAIIIAECLDELEKHLPVTIYATDIDADAMTVARAGVYLSNISADVTPERLKRFFVKEGSSYRIKKEIKETVVFAPQDFIKDPPFSKMDLICCRNLLIYLESEMQKKLLPLLHYALNPGGLLFLGTSEGVGEATDLFSVTDKKWKIFQRREGVIATERIIFPAAFAPAVREPSVKQAAPLAKDPIPRLAEKIFLDNYAPTFAVVDEKYRLVYVRGETGKYLQITSGKPNLIILDMAREGLRSELDSALHRATSGKKTVVHEVIQVRYNGGFQTINLTVAPLSEPGMPPGLLMVVFQEVGSATKEGKSKTITTRRTARLEEELRLTRERLQSSIEETEATNEELKSANEELQSNNEELQSTNEELDTSREELQSLNEELLTVNAELSRKTEMLTTANDDLKNYLNRTDIAIIFLDDALNIRNYTPATTNVFNIREIDLGRSLEEITSRLEYERVVEDAREVLRTLVPKEIELQRKDGHWYNMRILPYLTLSNVVGGLVMSFLDIDKQKQAAVGLRRLAAVVEDSNDAITTLDMDGRIVTWNRGARQMYGYSQKEAIGMNMSALVPEEKRDHALQFLKKVKRDEKVVSLDVKRQTKSGLIIDVWITVTKLLDDDGRLIGVATTERDITERKKREAEAAFLVSFAEGDPNPVVELDLHGKVKYLNPAARNLFPDMAKLGLRHPFLIDWRTMTDALMSKKTYVATREINAGGHWYLQTVIILPPTQSIRIYAKDITDQKQMEEKTRSLERLAGIGQLSGSIAHELRNPLAVVDSSLYFLNKTLPNADVKTKEHMARMKEGIRRCVDIIEAMLSLTRLNKSRSLPLDFKTFANTLIDETGLPASITVVRKFTTQPVTIAGDHEQLRIGLRNLITNAVQAMDGKGTLRVAISREGEMARLSVADTGPGISAENRDKVFEPLFSTKTFGIGLGLPITQQIIELHKGTITVETEPGWGAVFVIRLPLAEENVAGTSLNPDNI